jgi:hypothetical protein
MLSIGKDIVIYLNRTNRFYKQYCPAAIYSKRLMEISNASIVKMSQPFLLMGSSKSIRI